MIFEIKKISVLIKKYKWEILLSICLFSNLYPQLPAPLYYVTWGGFLYGAEKLHAKQAGKRAKLAYALIALIVFSTVVNAAVFDYRWILMCIILYITLSRTSYQYYKFKDSFLFVSLWGFLLTGPLNWYAHLIGHNEQLYNWKHLGETFTTDFSGYTNNPMWLSAACGIGIIFIVYWMNAWWSKGKKIYALLCLPVIYISIQTLVWGGSRSALGISIGASLLLIWLSNRKVDHSIIIIAGLITLGSILAPIIMSDAERMMSKKGGLELRDTDGKTSRSALWEARMDEFASSPVWGIGFGVTGIGQEAIYGRAETGSGWLTVLSQTGMLGFMLVLTILKRAYIPIRRLRGNQKMALYTSILVYLCLHTMFEAYLFQSGWYLCFVLWLLISVLDDYKKFELK